MRNRAASNESSILNIKSPTKVKDFGQSKAMKTVAVSASQKQKSTWFWFKGSDFYVTGMDFVFARIAIVS